MWTRTTNMDWSRLTPYRQKELALASAQLMLTDAKHKMIRAKAMMPDEETQLINDALDVLDSASYRLSKLKEQLEPPLEEIKSRRRSASIRATKERKRLSNQQQSDS